ncbi:MAG: sodium-translocating pyrophosphatase [Candidatus Bathyarchaeia archaeon]
MSWFINPVAIPLLGGVCSLTFVYCLIRYVLKQPKGTEQMNDLYEGIKVGAKSFLKHQFRVVFPILFGVSILFGVFLGFKTFVAFIIGGVLSFAAGAIAMFISTEANVRTAEAARLKKDNVAVIVASFAGGTIGMSICILTLIGICTLYLGFGDTPETLQNLMGFGFGASVVALFLQLGGGIFTKAADAAADVVGKVEYGLSEDDPRNAAVIADFVGDNVGDCAGRGADLFESYSANPIGTMILGFTLLGMSGLLLPLYNRLADIAASTIGIAYIWYKMRRWGERNFRKVLVNAILVTIAVISVVSFIVYWYLFPGMWSLYLCNELGLLVGLVVVKSTEYFVSKDKKMVKKLAMSALDGANVEIVNGLAIGMLSISIPIVFICLTMGLAYFIGAQFGAGLFGLAAASVGVGSITPIIMTADSYGPVADNASGIAKITGFSEEEKRIMDELDAVGNSTKAITKGYAMTCAALSAFILFSAFTQVARIFDVNIEVLNVFIAIFIGIATVFIFIALSLNSVNHATSAIIKEVRRQFREIVGLREGKAKPDYSRCVAIGTIFGIKGMILPTAITIITPIIVGLILGKAALAAFIISCTFTGVIMSIILSNVGGAWDNAKKLIESRELMMNGGAFDEAKKVAVISDAIGDPFKDVAGPSLHIMIKLIAALSITLVPLFLW